MSALPWLPLALLLASLPGCDDGEPPVERCSNAYDDDGDQLSDCDDPDCSGDPACQSDGDADLDADLDDADPVDSDQAPDADGDGDGELPCDGDVDREGAEVGRCDPALGSSLYLRVYDALMTCSASERPRWYALYWEAETPEGTQIELSVRTAQRFDDLPCALEVPLAVIPGDESPADVESALLAAGVENGLRHLELIARFSCPDGVEGAALRETNLINYCGG